MSEWSVPKGRRVCDACERPFIPDEALWSALVLTDAQLRRIDQCAKCHEAGAPDDPICAWKTTAPHPDKPKRTRLNTEAAGEVLKRLVSNDDPQYRALCYVLALGLVRRKVMKLTGSEPGPEPTDAELEAERLYAEAVAARAAELEAAAEAEAATAPEIPIPLPESPDPEPESPDPEAESPDPEAETGNAEPGTRNEDPEPLPPRPPPRAIGYLLLTERQTGEAIRVAELALADDEIGAVTDELRDLFAGDV